MLFICKHFNYIFILHFSFSLTSCCQSDRPTFDLPVSCFERNECTGLHWLPDDACAKRYRDSIEKKLQEFKEKLVEGSGEEETTETIIL